MADVYIDISCYIQKGLFHFSKSELIFVSFDIDTHIHRQYLHFPIEIVVAGNDDWNWKKVKPMCNRKQGQMLSIRACVKVVIKSEDL